MNKRLLGIAASVLAATLVSHRAEATASVINFNELTSEFGNPFLGPFNSKGFHFDNNAPGGIEPFNVWGVGNPFNADPAAAAISINIASTTTVMTKVSGGPFDFDAIEFGNVYNSSGNPENVTLLGTLENGGTVATMVTTNGLAGLTQFDFGSLFSDVVQVAWTPSNGRQNNFLQFDNVVVTAACEPAPASVLLIGLGGLAWMLRRKPASDANHTPQSS